MEMANDVVPAPPTPTETVVLSRPSTFAAPAAVVTGPLAPPTTTRTLADVLDELIDDVAEARAALLVSVDGFSIARNTSTSDEPAHSAMLAAAVGLGHQLAAMGGGETLRQLVIEHDAGLIVVWPIGTSRVLAVLTSAQVEQRRLRAFVIDNVRDLVGAV